MKKLLYVITIFFLVMAMGKTSLAYSNDEVAHALLDDLRERLHNDQIGTTNDFLALANYWNNHPTQRLLTNNTNGDIIYRIADWGTVNQSTVQALSDGYFTNFYTSRGNEFISGVLYASSYSMISPTDYGDLANFMPVNIDWYDYEFDPSIPTPDIFKASSSLDISNTAFYDYQVPIVLEMVPIPNNGREYYIIYYYRMFKARTVNITKNGNNNPVDNIEQWWSSPKYISHSQSTVPNGIEYDIDFNDDAIIKGQWEDFASDNDTTYTGLTTGWYNLWSDGNIPSNYHYPQNRWLGSFGSIFEITFCYAEIRDGQVYTGYWVRYNTDNPSKLALVNYSDQPIFQTGEELNYSTQSVSPYQVESEYDQEGSTVPNSINSGNNYTINVSTQQVPNDMQYPTIVSYNHDNVFTTFVGTYNNAGSTLSGFAQFLNNTLLWIPSEIWFIVGMGFSMAILIMIIKIL